MIEDYLRFRWVTQESDKDATQEATGDDYNDCFSGLYDDEPTDDEPTIDNEPCKYPDCGNTNLEENDTDETLCNI